MLDLFDRVCDMLLFGLFYTGLIGIPALHEKEGNDEHTEEHEAYDIITIHQTDKLSGKVTSIS